MMDQVRRVVGVLVFSSDNRLLLGRRSDVGVYPGMWQAPGGGIEAGETEEAAAHRELFEETGIVLQPTEELIAIDRTDGDIAKREDDTLVEMKFRMFRVKLRRAASEVEIGSIAKKLKSAEFSELRWVETEDLPKLDIVPAGVRLLSQLGLL